MEYFYYGYNYHEEHDLRLFMLLAKRSAVIVDIGSNTGVFSILGALSNPNATLYAFEPHRSNAVRMKKNVQLNGISNITLFEEAVGDQLGELSLTVPSDDAITDVSSANADFAKKMYSGMTWKTITVPVTTMDDFRKTLSEPVNLIKCDVETFEREVFSGMKTLMQHDRPTVIFECFMDNSRREFFNAILQTYSYHVYLILGEGLVYSAEGFENVSGGLNYLISPVKPRRTFISYTDPLLPEEVGCGTGKLSREP